MTTTANLNLTLISGSGIGVQQLNDDLEIIDALDFTGNGRGQKLSQRSLNIDDEVCLNSNRIFQVESVDCVSLNVQPTGSNIAYFYSADGGVTTDFYVNTGDAIPVRVTAFDNLNTGSAGADPTTALKAANNTWTGTNTFNKRIEMAQSLGVAGSAVVDGTMGISGSTTFGSTVTTTNDRLRILKSAAVESGQFNVTGSGVFSTSVTAASYTSALDHVTVSKTLSTQKLNVTGSSTFSSNITCAQSITVAGSIVASTDFECDGTSFLGTITANGDHNQFSKSVGITQTLNVSGTLYCTDFESNGGIYVDDTSAIQNLTVANGSTNNDVTLNGHRRVIRVRTVDGTSNATITGFTGRTIFSYLTILWVNGSGVLNIGGGGSTTANAFRSGAGFAQLSVGQGLEVCCDPQSAANGPWFTLVCVP